MDNMNSLFTCYHDNQFLKSDGDIFETFSKFSSLDLEPISSWLKIQFKNKITKNNEQSNAYRTEGNKYFARKDLDESLKLYTKSLNYSIPGGKEFGLALANRSAVSFEMEQYEECIKDINICLNSSYPNDLRPKIYLRKANCYLYKGDEKNLMNCLAEAFAFLDNNSFVNKNKHKKELEQLKKIKIKTKNDDHDYNRGFKNIPSFEEGENTKFLSASSKIKMAYNKEPGRHVIANEKIKKGDVLFIEKAFVCAPVYKENKEFNWFKCFNCLKDIISSVPCKFCTLCVYCSENCQSVSWNEFHQWECNGMQANIWYDLGIAFPAFRALLVGAKCGFTNDQEASPESFGNKENNYPYFNSLVSNLEKIDNVVPYLVMAGVVVIYLENYTNFFSWLLNQNKCPKNTLKQLSVYVGGLVTKHIAQLACNSSIIEHWKYSISDSLFPDKLISVACGMFLSVSIMNHSCRPNVTNFFLCDTIIVKALEDIEENEEVLNCYGIDYRTMTRDERQQACKSLYYFECKCVICSNSFREINFDNYSCPKCKGLVPDDKFNNFSFCLNCKNEYALEPFKKIKHKALKYLESGGINQLKSLIKCLELQNKILYKHHKELADLHYKLYTEYVKIQDVENIFKYFNLWLENEMAKQGESSRSVGANLYEAALTILTCNRHWKNRIKCLQNVKKMSEEAISILNLYYPAYIINTLNQKTQMFLGELGYCKP